MQKQVKPKSVAAHIKTLPSLGMFEAAKANMDSLVSHMEYLNQLEVAPSEEDKEKDDDYGDEQEDESKV